MQLHYERICEQEYLVSCKIRCWSPLNRSYSCFDRFRTKLVIIVQSRSRSRLPPYLDFQTVAFARFDLFSYFFIHVSGKTLLNKELVFDRK